MIIIIIVIIIIIYDFFLSGSQSFFYCTSLTQIVLTSGLPQIGPGGYIFQQTAVTSLIIPSTITAMSEFHVIISLIINIITINSIYIFRNEYYNNFTFLL